MKTLTKTTEALYNTVLSDRQLSAIVGGKHGGSGNSAPAQSYLSVSFEQVTTKNKSKTIVDVVYSGSTSGLLGLALIIAGALKGS